MRKLMIMAALAAIWSIGCSFTTVHLMGDSTMAEKDLSGGNPERGWGMMFQNFLDDSIKVINYAQNGRSTKSFIDRGLWDKVKANLKPGDWLFIQFGHNDAKESDPERYAAPFGAYQDNLRLFVRTAKSMGARPVLLTPVARRWFKENGLDRNCHTDYPAAMAQVAQEENVPLLDITTATLDWLEGLGDEASRQYFMISTGKDDNTHTVASGARKVTEIICEKIKGQLPELAGHLRRYDIVVSPDGHGDFATVQQAIDAVPDYSHEHITTIYIRKGVYKENVHIPHSKFRMHISGEDALGTIITFDKAAKHNWPLTGYPIGTSGSATIYIHNMILETPEGAVLWHCSQGKDRTGIGAAIILAALGADREVIVADFDRSNDNYRHLVTRFCAEVEARGGSEVEKDVVRAFMGVSTRNFCRTLDLIDRQWGSFESYLISQLGMEPEDLAALRDRYLE